MSSSINCSVFEITYLSYREAIFKQIRIQLGIAETGAGWSKHLNKKFPLERVLRFARKVCDISYSFSKYKYNKKVPQRVRGREFNWFFNFLNKASLWREPSCRQPFRSLSDTKPSDSNDQNWQQVMRKKMISPFLLFLLVTQAFAGKHFLLEVKDKATLETATNKSKVVYFHL